MSEYIILLIAIFRISSQTYNIRKYVNLSSKTYSAGIWEIKYTLSGYFFLLHQYGHFSLSI